MASTSKKRKHVTLTISQKCEILGKIKEGFSFTILAQQYNVGKSTIFDIKSKEEKIRSFVINTEKGPGSRKALKTLENPQLEDALFMWFLEQRRKAVPLSGDIVMEKAKFFLERFGKGEFVGSRGWLDKFKKRHGICQLKLSGEKLSNNEEAVKPFQEKFMDIIREKDLTGDQIYNADDRACIGKCYQIKLWLLGQRVVHQVQRYRRKGSHLCHVRTQPEHTNCPCWLLVKHKGHVHLHQLKSYQFITQVKEVLGYKSNVFRVAEGAFYSRSKEIFIGKEPTTKGTFTS